LNRFGDAIKILASYYDPYKNPFVGKNRAIRKEFLFMGLLSWIILGALAGWVASIIMKKNQSMGAFANIVVGVIGAFIGGFVMNLIGANADVTGFNFESFFVALVGSIILLAIVNLIKKGTVR
jgi:uncharacterized membrane protein YeaQ/YmgE (transglycosylase-associated protein family)